MTYLIIIVVLLAIIAPILRILPSKDDKEADGKKAHGDGKWRQR